MLQERRRQVSSFVESRARYVFGSDSWSHFSILEALKVAIIESVIALSQSMQMGESKQQS